MIALLAGLLATLAAPAPAADAKSRADGPRFDAGWFSIVPPRGWTLDQRRERPDSSLAVWVFPQNKDFEGYLSVSVFKNSEPLTDSFAAKVVSEAVLDDERRGAAAAPLRIGDAEHGFVSAWQSRYVGRSAGARHAMIQAELAWAHRVSFSCLMARDAVARIEPLCQKALRSLRVVDRAPAAERPKDDAAPPAMSGAVPLLR